MPSSFAVTIGSLKLKVRELTTLMEKPPFNNTTRGIPFRLLLNDKPYVISYHEENGTPTIQVTNIHDSLSFREIELSDLDSLERWTNPKIQEALLYINELLTHAYAYRADPKSLKNLNLSKDEQITKPFFLKNIGLHALQFNEPFLTIPALIGFSIVRKSTEVEKKLAATHTQIITEALLIVTANSLLPNKRNGWLVGGTYFILREFVQASILSKDKNKNRHATFQAIGAGVVCCAGTYVTLSLIS